MSNRHQLYRSLTRLYPRDFRRHYGEDLVQHFEDLVTDRGARAAWARTSLDVLITVPRYHLERIMNEPHGSTVLNLTIVLLAAGGLASTIVGAWPGIVLLILAFALAMAQRSALAHALRVPDSNRRRARLRAAAVLGGIFVVSFGSYLLTVGDTWTVRDTVLSLIGTPAMFGTVIFLVAGLLTPRTPGERPLAGTG